MYLCIKQEIIHELHKSNNAIDSVSIIETSQDLIVNDECDYTEYLPAINEYHRNILYLRYAENYTMKEIGEQIGCSKQRVKQILTTLLEQIKESNFE
jgi:RNA polymerase sigma factor (sigma-70 family)